MVITKNMLRVMFVTLSYVAPLIQKNQKKILYLLLFLLYTTYSLYGGCFDVLKFTFMVTFFTRKSVTYFADRFKMHGNKICIGIKSVATYSADYIVSYNNIISLKP